MSLEAKIWRVVRFLSVLTIPHSKCDAVCALKKYNAPQEGQVMRKRDHYMGDMQKLIFFEKIGKKSEKNFPSVSSERSLKNTSLDQISLCRLILRSLSCNF